MERRAQAAMEFLMTYGWAILAAVIVIGVLAYFGVFSPASYVPTSCVVSAPFGCDKNQVAATTADIKLVLRNGGSDSYDVQSVAVAGCGIESVPFTIASQGTQTVSVPCSPALASGSKFNGAVNVVYKATVGGVLNLTSSGSVTVKVP